MSLVNQHRAVADAFRPLRTHQRATEQLSGELHKSEVLLIARTLLVVETKNIYWQKQFFCVPIHAFGFHHKQCASD